MFIRKIYFGTFATQEEAMRTLIKDLGVTADEAACMLLKCADDAYVYQDDGATCQSCLGVFHHEDLSYNYDEKHVCQTCLCDDKRQAISCADELRFESARERESCQL